MANPEINPVINPIERSYVILLKSNKKVHATKIIAGTHRIIMNTTITMITAIFINHQLSQYRKFACKGTIFM